MKRILTILILLCSLLLTACNNASIGVIGGADGPTSIIVSEKNIGKTLSYTIEEYFRDNYVDERKLPVLDIDIENNGMSLDKLYKLSSFILDTFHTTWYEAKEEINEKGKTVWFHGFETMITGELWNIDLCFFDRETIKNAEMYCDDIAQRTSKI